MAPTRRILAPNISVGVGSQPTRLVYGLLSLASHGVFQLTKSHGLARRDADSFDPHRPRDVVFAVLIPVLVLLSGLFAGLTLGYMSLDQTQLNVLSISGTPEQRKYAKQIMPIRKNGHLLLVTLLLANMVVNESLPIIADPVLGGGPQSVAVSTVLIVIFSEIIPQSLFTRYGLYLGAKAAGFTKCLIYSIGIISWPVAKLLDWILGSNHGIIYRRVELKELIAMHASDSTHGGDLKHDTVTIIGATLDLQEKVVSQAMTSIENVFMLPIDAKLDYETLSKIVATGHSRVPVYEEVEIPVPVQPGSYVNPKPQKAKKIVGIFLVKQCVLLDPKDATPLRTLQLNRVPFVPNNESLLGILDKFQEGRSHIAIVSRHSVEKAHSVKKAVTGKRGLTRRFLDKVGMGDTSSEESESESEEQRGRSMGDTNGEETLRGDGVWEKDFAADEDRSSKKKRKRRRKPKKAGDTDGVEMQIVGTGDSTTLGSFRGGMTSMYALEQSMPADAVLAPEGADEFLQNFDPAVMPLGIITLEDVLEELIGEEIYDEFDLDGAHGEPYIHGSISGTDPSPPELVHPTPIPANKSLASMKGFSFLRSRSAPPRDRPAQPATAKAEDEKQDGEVVVPVIVPPADEKGAEEKANPALEAVLLDRKRRLARETTGTSSRSAVMGAKGKFKSSPIGSSNLNPATAASNANDNPNGNTGKSVPAEELNPHGGDTDVEDD
ncbi:DUF21-domain-containing protein [Hymenopellis radicata]|nr:DUF21-domain-containing protein [Hymenopellis radicata]